MQEKSDIIAVCAPYILGDAHFGLTKVSIESLLSSDPEHNVQIISVINRFDASPEKLEWLKARCVKCIFNDRNILARAWNIGIKTALELSARYVLVFNLDVFFEQKFLNNVISFANRKPESLIWGGTPIPGSSDFILPLEEKESDSVQLSVFMCDGRLFEEIGEFDENFVPAYHEDNDMLYRIKLKGRSCYSTNAALYKHLDRGTLKGAIADGYLEFPQVLQGYLDKSETYYIKKWGGKPGAETFTVPFGKNA